MSKVNEPTAYQSIIIALMRIEKALARLETILRDKK